MTELPQVYTGRGETAPEPESTSANTKIVCQEQFVVNENARELPKCSKSLHFREPEGLKLGLIRVEQKTNKSSENCRSFTAFAVGGGRISVFLSGSLENLGGIWPLRCSRRTWIV